MKSLWFVIPAHGRYELTAICLRQLRRTCDTLGRAGLEATAVVIADDDNLDTARELGFGIIWRNNSWLSRKFNDGIQLATDPAFNPRPANYVVPCGSDDWVNDRLFYRLPKGNNVMGFQHMCFVREDGREMTSRFLSYAGGSGIRIYPAHLMKPLGYRPADEDRRRGCDTSILYNVVRQVPNVNVVHGVTDPRWIVDWKSPGAQLNSYEEISHRYRDRGALDPFSELADVYPRQALEEMAAHYGVAA